MHKHCITPATVKIGMTSHKHQPITARAVLSCLLLTTPLAIAQRITATRASTRGGAGSFPPLFNAALTRPVWTSPSASTCGMTSRSAYCESTPDVSSVDRCNQAFCVYTCPGRTTLPHVVSLLNGELHSDIAHITHISHTQPTLFHL